MYLVIRFHICAWFNFSRWNNIFRENTPTPRGSAVMNIILYKYLQGRKYAEKPAPEGTVLWTANILVSFAELLLSDWEFSSLSRQKLQISPFFKSILQNFHTCATLLIQTKLKMSGKKKGGMMKGTRYILRLCGLASLYLQIERNTHCSKVKIYDWAAGCRCWSQNLQQD